MRTLFLMFMLLNTSIQLVAQNPIKPLNSRPLNSLYVNLLGDASLVSLNYERNFVVSPTFIISSKLGVGYNESFEFCFFGDCPPTKPYTTVPHHITGNLGKGRHFLEFGLGGTIIKGETNQPYILYPIVGYRILPLKSEKMNFRVYGQIPFSGIETNDILFIPLGISFGISF